MTQPDHRKITTINDCRYYINPFGERINFSIKNSQGSFRNTIGTPGTDKFDKQDFVNQVLELFVCDKVESINLVIAAINNYDKEQFFKNITGLIKPPVKEYFGVALNGDSTSIAPFGLRGIKASVSQQAIIDLIKQHAHFSINNSASSINLIASEKYIRARSTNKYFSQFTITTQLADRQTFTSFLNTNAQIVNIEELIRDLATISVGTIVSVSRKLSLDNINIINNSSSNNKLPVPYGVTGRAIHRIGGRSIGELFILEWIKSEVVWNRLPEFLKQYMRTACKEGVYKPDYVDISKNYEMKFKNSNQKVSKAGFASQMRNNQTEAEKAMWEIVRDRRLGIPFKRQIIIAGYIADFYTEYGRIAIEVDGKSHTTKKALDYDRQREIAFYKHQILTVRFKNEEVVNNPEEIANKIKLIKDRWGRTPTDVCWDVEDDKIWEKICQKKAIILSF